jgi:Asp-tRNA(Asn)/Glu-tRNA(Gln) amidotransferase A subunit family amidase
VPAGFDAAGRWPMGLQLVGQPHGDAGLLALAAGYERLAGQGLDRQPDAARVPAIAPAAAGQGVRLP